MRRTGPSREVQDVTGTHDFEQTVAERVIRSPNAICPLTCRNA